MAYDEALASRIRTLLLERRRVDEKAMFGGLGFMVNGNMAVAASGSGGMMVRVDPAESEALVAEAGVEPMVMRGRPMAGWLRVATEALEDDADLKAWVDRGVRFASSLPPK